MRNFEFETIEQSYAPLIDALIKEGQPVAPRGLGTRELSPVSITINDPRRNVISDACRRLNYGFMNAEFAWIMSQSNEAWIAHYNKNWLSFSDDGETLNGAYGDRVFRYRGPSKIIDQFEAAYEQLKADPLSRQATIVLFNPELDYRETKDKPCTNLMRFKIRNGKLQMIVFMRSNDVILGYPYDVFNFTSLQAVMASKLGVELGSYTHIVDSMHIYEDSVAWGQAIAAEQVKPSIYDREFPSNVVPNITEELQAFVNIEQSSRKLSAELDLSKFEEMLESMTSDYWRSGAAMLALYNLRKNHRPQADLDRVSRFITSEFAQFVDRYTELKSSK